MECCSTSRRLDLALLETFPAIRHAFSYGSAAFPQPGLYASGKLPMRDYIFVVECPHSWHHLNLQTNARHYSYLARLHPSVVTFMADYIGVGVYFNPAVGVQGQVIKYGVVGIETLLRDLSAWDTLLVAGRLHKPVRHIVQDTAVMGAIDGNLQAALAAALLMLPESFTTQELFESLCGISYIGDIRMSFAEDKHKVQRIVEGSWKQLQQLYRPALEGPVGCLARATCHAHESWRQNMTSPSRAKLLEYLPQMVRTHLGARYCRMSGCATANAICPVPLEDVGGAVRHALYKIARRSSVRQACVGVLSAGALKGIQYLLAKVGKHRVNY